jgi:hypothetical protein
MFSTKAVTFFNGLEKPHNISRGIEVINPYKSEKVRFVVGQFFNKFYNDENSRLFIFGINPGRFGGGLTGISFTDPVALKNHCGIDNNLGTRKELSSEFIYTLIDSYGGTNKFFSECFLSALYPLALLRDGKNYNFYDDKKTFNTLLPYLKKSVKQQSELGARRDKVISLGLKNAGILTLINDELKIFDKIDILEHPRFIMQYRRKHLKEYIHKYLSVLRG